MFKEGRIFYFTPFYFKNGHPPKEKFFLILKNNGGSSIVASLPTSLNNAPALMDGTHGCINHDDRKFNCYVFGQGNAICDNGFAFRLPTHIYGDQVDQYEVEELTFNNTIVEGQHYEIVGDLKKVEFENLLDCIKNSNAVKKKVIRLLSN